MLKTVKGVVRGIGYALEGYTGAFREDAHFRINLVLSLAGTAGALILLKGELSLLVALCNYLVLVAELINTAVERAVDVATEEFNPKAKLAKDAAAAAVLTIGLFALALDLRYLLPEIVKRVGG